MDKLKITGGVPLNGQAAMAGAKNAALPILAAALLTRDAVQLSNVPQLADVATVGKLCAAWAPASNATAPMSPCRPRR